MRMFILDDAVEGASAIPFKGWISMYRLACPVAEDACRRWRTRGTNWELFHSFFELSFPLTRLKPPLL